MDALDSSARWCVLTALSDAAKDSRIIAALIGDDVELYRRLLGAPGLREHFRAPLRRPASPNWKQKAMLALEAGHSSLEVALGAYGDIHSVTGSESTYWSGWIVTFEQIAQAEPALGEVAAEGIEIVRSRRDEALRREGAEAVYGLI